MDYTPEDITHIILCETILITQPKLFQGRFRFLTLSTRLQEAKKLRLVCKKWDRVLKRIPEVFPTWDFKSHVGWDFERISGCCLCFSWSYTETVLFSIYYYVVKLWNLSTTVEVDYGSNGRVYVSNYNGVKKCMSWISFSLPGYAITVQTIHKEDISKLLNFDYTDPNDRFVFESRIDYSHVHKTDPFLEEPFLIIKDKWWRHIMEDLKRESSKMLLVKIIKGSVIYMGTKQNLIHMLSHVEVDFSKMITLDNKVVEDVVRDKSFKYLKYFAFSTSLLCKVFATPMEKVCEYKIIEKWNALEIESEIGHVCFGVSSGKELYIF